MMERGKLFRQTIVHTIVVVVVVLLAIGTTWYLTRNKAQQLDTELASLKTQSSAMERKRDELPLIAKALPQLAKDSGTVAAMFPTNPGDRELIEFLEGELKRSGVEFVSWQLTEPKILEIKTKGKGKKTELEEMLDEDLMQKANVITFNMQVRGGFPGILRFLEDLKESGRYIRISTISCQPEQNLEAQGIHSWRLAGDMFFISEQKDLSEKFADLRKTLASAIGYKPEFQEGEPETSTPRQETESETGDTSAPSSEAAYEPDSVAPGNSTSAEAAEATEGGKQDG